MPRHVLHPVLSWIVYFLGGLAVLQWLIIVPLAMGAGVIDNLDCWVGTLRASADGCAAGSRALAENFPEGRVKPFSRDFFFIEWNALPILLCAAHFALSTHYEGNHRVIRKRFRKADGDEVPETKAPIRDHLPLVFVLLIILNAIAITAQFNKQADFAAEHSDLYWWDLRINPTIFYVRLIFLGPVITLVALVLWESFWGLWTLFRLMRDQSTSPQILDPQCRFGMQPYGVYAMLLIVPWFLALATSLLEWLDHQGTQGAANNLGTILIGVLGIVGFYLIAEPMIRLHLKLERHRQEVLAAMDRETQELESYLSTVAQGRAADSSVMSRASPAYIVYQHVANSSSWPFPKWFGPPTFISLVSPFLGAFGVSLSAFVDLIARYFQAGT